MRGRNHGVTLMEVVVAVGLVAIVALIVANISGGFGDLVTTLRDSSVEKRLRVHIEHKVDCGATFTTRPDGCDTAPNEISLFESDGTTAVIAKSQSNRYLTFEDRFEMRALCVECSGCADDAAVRVEYRPLGETQWTDLYGGIPLPCSVPVP